jgi:hypothetical protein
MAFPSDSLKKRTSAAAERARQVDEMEESCSSLVSVPPHWAFRLIPLTFIFSPARHRAGTGIMGQHQAGVALNLMKSQIISACAYVVAGLLSQSNIPIEIWPDRRAACPAAFLWRAGRNLDGSD